ncbi:hypothetical protein NM688_g1648 [Phlebia brevispora]|uniref:Uncharacterized protein n=1 Tax=Phlebia brevispora TaxID=194682 RepID=A0ACC1TB66_9APHY|nr:hypothetical protein NM688_g1648 [Phlebia brevispora]
MESTDQSATSQTQYPTAYSNPYAEQPSTFNPDTYNATAFMQPGVAAAAAYSSSTPYPRENTVQFTQPSPPPQINAPERSYTLGGGGYGANTVPVLHESQQQDTTGHYLGVSGESHLPSPYSPLTTPTSSDITATSQVSSPVDMSGPSSGMRPLSPEQPMYEDSPPMYDDATAQPPGEWNTKQPR